MKILQFVIACLFIIVGAAMQSSGDMLAFIGLVGCGILIFPPVLDFLERKHKKPNVKVRMFLGFILIALSLTKTTTSFSVEEINVKQLFPTLMGKETTQKNIEGENQKDKGQDFYNQEDNTNNNSTNSDNTNNDKTNSDKTTSENINNKSNEESNQESVSSNATVHFIDVGQADCILIEANGEYMLIDAGNNEDADLVVSYLEKLGVKKLAYVIGTHPHEDHIGGLDAVINHFSIGKVILSPKEHTTKTFEDVITAIEHKNLKLTKPVIGKTYTLGGASFTIIAPNGNYGDDLNNWSVGIKFTNGKNSFIFCGDAEGEAEKDIIATGIDLHAEVLKLNHHGSNTSNSDTFLDAVNPKYAVICTEIGNSYGHPHKEVLLRLKERGIQIFRTDEQGTIIATSDGEHVTWNVEPSTTYKVGN